MSEDSKAMFQSKNVTLPDGWILNEPQISSNDYLPIFWSDFESS